MNHCPDAVINRVKVTDTMRGKNGRPGRRSIARRRNPHGNTSGVGMDLIADIVQIYANYDFPTEVLVASVRGPQHVLEAAKLGADVATLPPAVIKAMYNHPLTDKGLQAFLDDWAKTGQSILGS